ncbi:Sec1-like protein [Pseudocohnilembus persalinus]|uniref:Sec1-like protein n=1 Tax=Pseudocohnilembus persalinus TaxID=266149 RepID=A0A0V0R9K4_PSEPJ|nr:Sec1-like protein [Pseudocohnilembus persalinus]|eukprot:KRX11056.1 Sec1-like protein [Pseudocohnilembus persalinus]
MAVKQMQLVMTHKQSIVGGVSSKIDRIQNEVDKDIEGIKSYYLSINYRSTPEIIQFSNQIIIHSSELIKKEMNYQIQQQQSANVSQSDKNKMHEEIELLQSKKPYIQSYRSLYEQNNKILKKVVSLIKNQGVKPNQIAILSPYNKPLKYLEELFEKHNSINPPHNQIQYIPLITQQDYIVQKSKQRQIRNDILDIAVEINQQVVLSTIHKSKGLEWDFVFVIGCNDDFFPGIQTKEKVEEHRRLFYVASTRAAKNLYFNFVNNQKFFRISRFFTEMMSIQNIKLYFEFDENEIPGQCFSLPQGMEEIKPPFLTVSGEILQILDDFQYYKMRQEQIFPEIQDQVIHIHQHFNYSDQILEKQLMQDFQNFLLVYLQRKISEKFHTPSGYQNLSANSVLYTMSLSINYYQTYEKYQKIIQKKIMEKQITQQTKHKELPHIFKEYFPECFKMEEEEEIIQSSYDDIGQNSQPNNIQCQQQNELNQSDCSISNILKYVNDEVSENLQIQNQQNQSELNQTQNQNDQNLNQNNTTNKQKIIFTPELQELMEIIEAIQTVAELNKIPIEQVQVSDQQYFPEDYDYSEFINEYQIFKDPKNQTKDIIRTIYQISLLQQIFEKRRRLLYIDASMIEQCINQYFLQDTIIDKNPQFVENNIYIQNNEYKIEGTIDLIVDDTAYFFRSSNSKKPSIEQVLSALVTISIFQIENEQQHLENINKKRTHSKQESHQINYIVFYNCMQGTLVKFDISVFDQQYQLLQHLKKYRDIYCKADNLNLIQDQQMKFQLLDNDIIQKNIQKLQENGQIQKIQQQGITRSNLNKNDKPDIEGMTTRSGKQTKKITSSGSISPPLKTTQKQTRAPKLKIKQEEKIQEKQQKQTQEQLNPVTDDSTKKTCNEETINFVIQNPYDILDKNENLNDKKSYQTPQKRSTRVSKKQQKQKQEEQAIIKKEQELEKIKENINIDEEINKNNANNQIPKNQNSKKQTTNNKSPSETECKAEPIKQINNKSQKTKRKLPLHILQEVEKIEKKNKNLTENQEKLEKISDVQSKANKILAQPSIREKYEELVQDDVQLILPPKYKEILNFFEYLDLTLEGLIERDFITKVTKIWHPDFNLNNVKNIEMAPLPTYPNEQEVQTVEEHLEQKQKISSKQNEENNNIVKDTIVKSIMENMVNNKKKQTIQKQRLIEEANKIKIEQSQNTLGISDKIFKMIQAKNKIQKEEENEQIAKKLNHNEKIPTLKKLASNLNIYYGIRKVTSMALVQEEQVTLYFNLSNEKREKLYGVNTIYFIAPVQESIDQVIQDFQKNLQFQKAQQALDNQIIDKVARNIYCICRQLNAVPLVHYRTDIQVHLKISERLEQIFQNEYLSTQEFRQKESNYNIFNLILHERSVDLGSILIHPLHYGALIHDVLQIKNNNVEMKNKITENKEVIYDLDPQTDPFWNDKINKPFPEVLEAMENEFQKYTSELTRLGLHNKENKNNDSQASQIGTAVDEVTELKEKRKKVDMHTNIATFLTEQISEKELDKFFELGSAVMQNRYLNKQEIRQMEELLASQKPEESDKLRLLILFAIYSNDQKQTQEFIEKSGIKTQKYLKVLEFVKAYNNKKTGDSKTDFLFNMAKNMAKKVNIGKDQDPFIVQIIKQLSQDKQNQFLQLQQNQQQNIENYAQYQILKPQQYQSKPKQEIVQNQQQNFLVFCVEGGGYAEYAAVQEYAQKNNKNIIYGGSTIYSPKDLLIELSELV